MTNPETTQGEHSLTQKRRPSLWVIGSLVALGLWILLVNAFKETSEEQAQCYAIAALFFGGAAGAYTLRFQQALSRGFRFFLVFLLAVAVFVVGSNNPFS